MDGRSEGLRGKLACRCVLVDVGSSLVLIDTGFGLRDVADPLQRLSRFFLRLLDPEFREDLTAVRQIEKLGYSARDVRHIVLTHLDFDHAGGLDDFPEATVHLLSSEVEDAALQRTWLDRQRFRPQQWSSAERWTGYDVGDGEPWFGFSAVRNLRGVPPEILLVPLRGHTIGHAGVAVREPRGWLFVAGDAYFDHDELDLENPRCTPGLRAYQWLMEKDRRARLANQRRLRHLVRDHGDEVHVICSHDPRELERDMGRPLDAPPVTFGVGSPLQVVT
jgi:glyoxylase-like metal-dependent hydrolase (beta-lactamase superfamily II)